MTDQPTSGDAAEVDLSELGRRLYEQALVRRDEEVITDPRGQRIGWLLDTRMPMLEGDLFNEVGRELARRLRERNIRQVAGYGFGSYALVGSVLAAGQGTSSFKGGFIRKERKPHGRRRLVEGPLRRTEPVVLLDDIINSGRSATRALSLLDTAGFETVGLLTLFDFTWSGGRAQIEERGLWVDSLLELNLQERTQSSSDSS